MYLLSVQPYLDQHYKCYKNIITINIYPKGPLQHFTQRINPPKLSPFKENSPCCENQKCILALKSINNSSQLMCVDELPSLIAFLTSNQYEIDSNITKIMLKSDVKLKHKILFFIKYNEN
tara:strand:- start:43 stop:402 length:360 start_codon:yes stop_codon:yes gene_type:complete